MKIYPAILLLTSLHALYNLNTLKFKHCFPPNIWLMICAVNVAQRILIY